MALAYAPDGGSFGDANSQLSWDGAGSVGGRSNGAWRDEVLGEWRVPPDWSTQMWSEDGVKHIDDCTLVRINVQESVYGPYRQRFSRQETDDQWTPLLYLFVSPLPLSGGSGRRYVLERAEEPHRTRIRWDRDEKPQARDTTRWRAGQQKRAKFPTSKAHISAAFHSFRLIFGRAIISRSGLDAWILSRNGLARNTHVEAKLNHPFAAQVARAARRVPRLLRDARAAAGPHGVPRGLDVGAGPLHDHAEL